jgi:hypothetical protein
MKVSDIACLNVSRLAFATTSRMTKFLRRILKGHRFEEMKIHFSTVATDLAGRRSGGFQRSGRRDRADSEQLYISRDLPPCGI